MKKIAIVILSFIAFNCGSPGEVFPVKGTVHRVLPDSMEITIAHDTIQNLMMPMVMPFKATLRSIMFFYFRYKNESEVSNASSSSLKLPSFSTYAFSIAIRVCESLNNSLRPIQ